ncbi:MAG: quercetin 2,3-dioxygenase [Bdellovibrionales bacterium GWA2_49_15]|nr:MAG: quercetin 2,3-dioxygenase [Bdellovibrionales bacterium GWA2_49_15]HAZ13027.1 quercetin 2,3-dioxygenase [Bdellovibrionales bacterium]
MITIRKSLERGHADHGWLQTNHTFSFANYYEPKYLGFRALRVINEDQIAPESGFPSHSHQDMEIITYVTEGALEHQDSMGNTTVIKPGEVQLMCAGTGVVHSEYNRLLNQPTHLLQIWITPDKENYPPGYSQKSFVQDFSNNTLVLVASRHGRNGSLTINQDVDVYVGRSALPGGKMFKGQFDHQWVQVIKGEVEINDQLLGPGDGAALSDQHELNLHWSKNSEFIIFDLI